MRAASCSDFASGGCGMCVHSMNEIEGICDNMCSFHIFHMRSYCACFSSKQLRLCSEAASHLASAQPTMGHYMSRW